MTFTPRTQEADNIGNPSVFIIAMMMVLTPGLGIFNEEMLQDTFKSMLVVLGTLIAALVFFWQRRASGKLVWHPVMWLPIALTLYALGSMIWSHTYLGGVEAVRWCVLSLLLLVTINVLTIERWPALATGIHLGAVMAAFWASLQFWFNFGLFIQGPNPASTFVNRNFLAEFLVCTLPFAAWLLARATTASQSRVLACSTGWVVLAILMTGTRSALVVLCVLTVVLPWILIRNRQFLALGQWTRPQTAIVLVVLLGTTVGLGQIGSHNPRINADYGPKIQISAWDRSVHRIALVGQATEYQSGSSALRIQMWLSTARMIAAHPLTGVGAGAWEVQVPLYQDAKTQIEIDYYAHSEPLQLVAEYGLLGWLVAWLLGAYIVRAIRNTRALSATPMAFEATPRWIALSSLLALLAVSCAGFPFRLATTGAMLMLALASLAASDARIGFVGRWRAYPVSLAAHSMYALVAASMLALGLAAYISYLATACEQKIVRAVTTALDISHSGLPANHPSLAPTRAQVLTLIREGVAINPHYRKITPMVADELARWGDWENAAWVWESVVASRPYVVAIHTNIARCYLRLGQLDKAGTALARARQLQPEAPSVRALQAFYLFKTGQLDKAQALAHALLDEGIFDMDVIDLSYELAMKNHLLDLAIQSMNLRKRTWPEYTVDSLLKMGDAYYLAGSEHAAQALDAYQQALALTPPSLKGRVKERIPPAVLGKLPAPDAANSSAQMSASKG